MDGAIYLKECYMKLYTKSINGQTHVMPANKIVIIKDDMQVFNPTEEMLLEEEDCKMKIKAVLFDLDGTLWG